MNSSPCRLAGIATSGGKTTQELQISSVKYYYIICDLLNYDICKTVLNIKPSKRATKWTEQQVLVKYQLYNCQLYHRTYLSKTDRQCGITLKDH